MRLKRPWREQLDAVDAPEVFFSPDVLTRGVDMDERSRYVETELTGGFLAPKEQAVDEAIPKAVSYLGGDPGDEDVMGGATRNFNTAFSLEEARHRRITTAFAVIASKVAEDMTGIPVPGDDEWAVGDLMGRKLSHKPLTQCRQSREKESLIVVLDSSGSCLAQSRFYTRIAHAALMTGDVILYDAPNAGITAKKERSGWEPVDDTEWPFAMRNIIFFGDFDGGDAVVEASRRNKIWWFCSETRYPSMNLHPWCTYSLAQFRGKYFPCATGDDFLRLMKKVR